VNDLRVIDHDERGDFLSAPTAVDSLSWPIRECVEHRYAGIAPCPVPPCGGAGHEYVAYRIAGFPEPPSPADADYDTIEFGEKRTFRRGRGGDQKTFTLGWFWLERE
jgi:hypothetical protein